MSDLDEGWERRRACFACTSLRSENARCVAPQVHLWISHVLIGLSALTYTAAFGVILDGATNAGAIGKANIDPFLKEKGIDSPAKVYEAIQNCQDPVVKHLVIWLISLQRTWGAFQVALGGGLWCVIFLLPIEHRAPVHFCIAFLQVVAGLVAGSLFMGGPLPDLVVKIGGSKPGEIVPLPETEPATGGDAVAGLDFARPGKGSPVKADFWSHQVLGVINIGLGVCSLLAA